jgi:hypothetical protein
VGRVADEEHWSFAKLPCNEEIQAPHAILHRLGVRCAEELWANVVGSGVLSLLSILLEVPKLLFGASSNNAAEAVVGTNDLIHEGESEKNTFPRVGLEVTLARL